MTKIKLCGLSSEADIRIVNELKPDYIGFVFWQKSRRYVTIEQAIHLKSLLDPQIRAVGVFVDADIQEVTELLERGAIDCVQLHGKEDDDYIGQLRARVSCPIIQAYKIRGEEDVRCANASVADVILLDSGMGTGKTFDWTYIQAVERPYFLAGGLTPENVAEAVRLLHPYGVDASSSLETDGKKDEKKMQCFVQSVRTAM